MQNLKKIKYETLVALFGYAAIPISNIAVIWSLKTNGEFNSFTVYALSSAAVSLFIIFTMSKWTLTNKSFYIFSVAPLVLCASYFIHQQLFYLGCIIIVVVQQGIIDFWTTQFKLEKLALYRIIFLVVTVLSIIVLGDIVYLIFFRQALILICFNQVGPLCRSEKLKLGNPSIYIVGTHFIYYGHLSFVSFVATEEFIRPVFITIQIFHQLILKTLDYAIRASYVLFVSPRFLINTVAGCVSLSLPFSVFIFQFQVTIILVSLVMTLLLYHVIIKYSFRD